MQIILECFAEDESGEDRVVVGLHDLAGGLLYELPGVRGPGQQAPSPEALLQHLLEGGGQRPPDQVRDGAVHAVVPRAAVRGAALVQQLQHGEGQASTLCMIPDISHN